MREPVYVCRFDPNVMPRIRDKAAAIRVDRCEDIIEAALAANQYNVRLRCLLVDSEIPLANIPFREDWSKIPLAVYVPSLGRFRRFADQIEILRHLNIRVYIPTSSIESYAHLRILSSLGINTAIVFDDGYLDWEELNDLMIYSVFGFVGHSPIEPFAFIIRNYKITEALNFAGVYFDDPATFLHIDGNGNAALTRRKFLDNDVFPLDPDNPFAGVYTRELRKYRAAHKEFFLKEEGCAYCPGWRICLGKFSHLKEKGARCGEFFSDLLDAVERYQEIQSSKVEQWQP